MSGEYISKSLRALISQQARHRCGYCLTQETVVGTPMEIDHLVPQSLGGATLESNLWLACSLCNEHKGNRIAAIDPENGEIAPLFNPRAQSWSEHFAWSEEGSHIVGLTAVGRATVIALNLNRPSLVRARRRWAAVGWHPPHD